MSFNEQFPALEGMPLDTQGCWVSSAGTSHSSTFGRRKYLRCEVCEHQEVVSNEIVHLMFEFYWLGFANVLLDTCERQAVHLQFLGSPASLLLKSVLVNEMILSFFVDASIGCYQLLLSFWSFQAKKRKKQLHGFLCMKNLLPHTFVMKNLRQQQLPKSIYKKRSKKSSKKKHV